MSEKVFDPKKLHKLNDPKRLTALPPKFIMDHAGMQNPEVIIDLGAGTGFFSIPFAQEFDQSKIFACDISDIMIEWMKKNIVSKYSNITPMKMENNNIALGNDIADFLLMINLHHELDNPEKTLKESKRLLRSGGKIIISDWKKEKTTHGPPVEYRYDVYEVKEQLHAAGFIDIRMFTEFPLNFLIIAEK